MPYTRISLAARVALALALLIPAALTAQSYEYDAVGRLIQVAYAQGGGVAYTYDVQDNMTAVAPLGLAPAPTDVEVTRLSETSARIRWQSDPSATGYVIERRQGDSGAWEQVGVVGGSTNTFIDNSLEPGAEYSYRVRALNSDGASAPSAEATFGGPPTPTVSQNGVINGASFEQGRAISPGSIVSVFGENIGIQATSEGINTISVQANSIPLTTELGDYSLRFGDIEAPLFYVGGYQVSALSPEAVSAAAFAGQINAQVPWEVPLGQSQVRVVYSPEQGEQLISEPAPVAVAAISPALFTFDYGPGRAVGLNVKLSESDDVIPGSFTEPVGSIPGAATQPAKLGGVVTLFANGLGPTDPPAVTGADSLDALRTAAIEVKVYVGGAEAQVLFAGLAPQFVGLCQINIVVPLGAVPGDAVPIKIVQGGLESRGDVTIAVRP